MSLEIVHAQRQLRGRTDVESWLGAIKRTVGARILSNLDQDTSNLDRYLEISPVANLPGAFACCSFYQADINEALTRAGLFMGAGRGMRPGTLVAHDDPRLINYQKLVAGHNLPGRVVREFFAAAAAARDPKVELSPAELSFRQRFLEADAGPADDQFYVIGFSVQSTKDQAGVFAHEIFHAHFNLRADYRRTISNFWAKDVEDADKIAITETIGHAYNVDDQDLVIDEFQAYLLQPNATRDQLGAFVPRYREKLRARLQENNIISYEGN